MVTEAQVPDSCILNDSLEEVISPIIPLIKYSPLNLPANRNAPLGFEEEDHTRVAMTSSPKEIVTESPISSPLPFRRSPKLKIIPFFGRKKTKKQNSVAAKKLTTKSPSSPPPPPPPSSSSSQAESSSGDSSLSAEGAKMLGSTSNSLSKPFKPVDETLNAAKYFSSSMEGKSRDDTSTSKMAEKKVKKKDKGLVGLQLQLKNFNKTGKITKKMEKIASSCKKESKKDEGTSKKKGAKEAGKKAKLGASKKKDEGATSRRKKKDEEKTSTCTSKEDAKDVEGNKKETAINKDEEIEPGKKDEDGKTTKKIHVDKSRRRDEEMDSTTTSKDEVTENKKRKEEEIDSSIDSCIKKDEKLDTKDQTAIEDECDSKEEPVSTKAKDVDANETLQTESTVEVLVSKANNLGTGGKGKTTKVKVKKLSLKRFQVKGPENGEGDEGEEEERQRELEEFLKEEEKLDKKIQRERKRLSQQKSSLNRKKTKKYTVSIRTESIVKSIPAQLSSPSDQSHQSSSPESFSGEDSLPPTPGNDPPAPSNDDGALPTQNTSPDSNGIWVQCDNPNCLKWRLLSDIRDPMEIPDKWYCNMNKDSRYSSCDVDEEVWSNLDSNEVYVYSPYVPGSVLLAKLEGYPWWPAMVEADPDTGLYYEAERESGKTSPATPVRYHVVFFDTPVSRSWIHSLNTATFTRDTTIRNCGPAIPTKYQSGLSVAISQAHGALGLTLNERLSQWGFSHRYGKGRKRRGSTKQEGGKPSKRTKNKPKNEKENVPENEHL